MALGERVKRRRKELGMTQYQLAEAIGVSQSVIGSLEKRDSKKSDHTNKLALALGVSVDWLSTGEDVNEEATIVKYGASTYRLTEEHYLLIALFSNLSDTNQEMVIRFMQDNQQIARPKITQLLKGTEKNDTGN